MCEFIRNNRHFEKNFVFHPTDLVDFTKCKFESISLFYAVFFSFETYIIIRYKKKLTMLILMVDLDAFLSKLIFLLRHKALSSE